MSFQDGFVGVCPSDSHFQTSSFYSSEKSAQSFHFTRGTAIFQCLLQSGLELAFSYPFFTTENFSRPVDPEMNPGHGIAFIALTFILATVFQTAICWDAISEQNIVLYYAFTGFSVMTSIFSTIQLVYMSNLVQKDFLIAVCGTSFFFSFLYAVLAVDLYRRMGWGEYKTMGADTRVRTYFHRHRVFLSLITIDFFVFSMYMIYYLVLVLNPQSFEFIILCCILPMALLILVFAVLGIKKENHVLMYLFITGIFFLLFYNGFLLSRIFDPTFGNVSLLTKVVSLFWASFGLLCALLTTVSTFTCLQYFGRGFLSKGDSCV